MDPVNYLNQFAFVFDFLLTASKTAELQDGPVSQEVSNIAKENGVAIAYGYSEKSALDTRCSSPFLYF